MKSCSVTGCNNPVWSKGVCKAHTPRAPLNRSPKNFGPNDAERRNNFFMSIWRRRPHVCEICGRPLGSEPLTYMFDHLLEKSKYPDLKWEPDNIVLACLECHDLKNRGRIGEKYREKINFAITKFNVS